MGGATIGEGEPSLEQRESVATLLRRSREEFGEDLRAVAHALRIRYVYLKSIEEGRFKELPGATYAVGFVRSYAEYLGLDGEEIVERFKEEVDNLDQKQELVFPTPVPEGKVPGGALILISVLLVAVAYGTWFYLSSQGKTIADLVPAVPEELLALIEDEAPATMEPSPEGDPTQAIAASDPSDLPVSTVGVDGAEMVDAGGLADAPDSGTPAAPTPNEPSDGATAVTQSSPAATVRRNGMPAMEPTVPTEGEDAPVQELTIAELTEAPLGEAAPPPEPPSAPAASAAEEASSRVTLARVIGARQEAAQTDGSPAVEPLPTAESSADESAPEPSDDSAIPPAPAMTQIAATRGREPQVYGVDNSDARIILRARQDSWVQVRDAQDGLLITRVLRSGDEYRVPNRPGLTLLTGNAGGIEIEVDGAKLSPIGPVGSVRRDVVLDPEALLQGTAIPQ